jgi:hypothetical protein
MLVGVTGCGSGFGDVTGTVTSRGELVTSGTVLLLASDKLSHSGIIEDNGRYTIPKVPVGIAKIAVLSPGPDAFKDPNVLPPEGGTIKKVPQPIFRGDPKKWIPIPEKYQEFDGSGLTLTVTPGANRHNISLD